MASFNILADAPERFMAHDYTTVAMLAKHSHWETFAAYGLSGKTKLALDGLSGFSHSESRFYAGVAQWIAGLDQDASATLRSVDHPYADALLKLIEKPQINVIAQLPFGWSAEHLDDKKFKLRIVGDGKGDVPRIPYASAHTWVDSGFKPDFFLSSMIEWHDIPLDIQELSCPLFGTTADYDAHIQTVYPWLGVFDEIVVPTYAEWSEVTALSKTIVSSFPKLYGSAHPFSELNLGERAHDIFISGSLINSYFADKADLFCDVLKIENLNIKNVTGFSAEYWDYLGQAKATWTYVRRPFGMPSRGIEALCMGCGVVAQNDSALLMYADQNSGVLTYSSGSELQQALKKIINEWSTFKYLAQAGAVALREEFALKKVFSQILRYLTFRAAAPRTVRKLKPRNDLVQKDWFFMQGRHDPASMRESRRLYNLSRVESQLSAPDADVRVFIDAARECAIEAVRAADPSTSRQFEALDGSSNLIQLSVQLHELGLSKFPLSLALRFNLVRLLLHAGTPDLVTRGLKEIAVILSQPPQSWELKPLDDLFPLDFYRGFFNYRRYLEIATEALKENSSRSNDLIQLVLASLHFYIGHYHNPLFHFARSSALDPSFAPYKLKLAAAQLEEGLRAPNRNELLNQAINSLAQLAERSVVFEDAFRMLSELKESVGINFSQLAELEKQYNRFKQGNTEGRAEDWLHVALRPAAVIPFGILARICNGVSR